MNMFIAWGLNISYNNAGWKHCSKLCNNIPYHKRNSERI